MSATNKLLSEAAKLAVDAQVFEKTRAADALVLLVRWAMVHEGDAQQSAMPDQHNLAATARPIDANTAALIRAAEQREQPKPCPCGGEFARKEKQIVCGKCGRAVRVKAAPESLWVPENERDLAAEAAALQGHVRELQAERDASDATADRLRGELLARDQEIERLQAADALSAPAYRCAHAEDVIKQLRDVIRAATAHDRHPDRTQRAIAELIRALQACLPMGPHRIEFGVKEVLQ